MSNIEELIDSFPRLMHGEPPSIPGYVEAGWHPIVMRLMSRIDALLDDELAATFQVAQVKEKFGGLRFYFDLGGDTDFTMDIVGVGRFKLPDEDGPDKPPRRREIETIKRYVTEAEEEASRTCEKCGAPGRPGRLRPTGWVLTLCERHHAEREEGR